MHLSRTKAKHVFMQISPRSVTMKMFLVFALQLLNQFENTGPPPADKERIKSLPTISITQEHVGKFLLHHGVV